MLASVATSKIFGKQMERGGKRWLLFEAKAEAFPGDRLPWSWSMWEKRFSDLTPILDFIHVLSYLFLAAKAVHERSTIPGVNTSVGCAVPDTGRGGTDPKNYVWGRRSSEPPLPVCRISIRAECWPPRLPT